MHDSAAHQAQTKEDNGLHSIIVFEDVVQNLAYGILFMQDVIKYSSELHEGPIFSRERNLG